MALPDDNESTYAFTPLMVSQGSRAWAQLSDLAVDLVDKSAALRSSLPAPISRALADLVRSMNCYYSNLIEGHNTHPVDIERALHNDYSADSKKRDLQLEAKAHITVQKWIDDAGMTDAPTSPGMIVELHRRFYERLPN